MESTQPFNRSRADVRPAEYQRIAAPWGEAVLCTTPEQPVALMLELMRYLDGPLIVLYLLLEDREGSPPPGRYESPVPTGRGKIRRFGERFAEFLEQDGRHALWIMDVRCTNRIIFDRHGVVFAYGRLDAFEGVLVRRGFTPGHPALLPPDHRPVERRFDIEERRLHEWWSWRPCPLWPGDEL